MEQTSSMEEGKSSHSAGVGSPRTVSDVVEPSNDEDQEEDEDMVLQVNHFFAELSSDHGRKRRRLIESGSNLPRRKSVLPPHLSQVMGNANLRLATGDRAGSIELCMEIIRQGAYSLLLVKPKREGLETDHLRHSVLRCLDFAFIIREHL